MPFTLDPEVGAVLTAMAAAGALPATPRGEALTLRAVTNVTLELMDAAEPDSLSVSTKDYAVGTRDGSSILVRAYMRHGEAPGAAVVYFHGGGMVCGSVQNYDRLVAKYVEVTGVPFFSVDYRLAPEVRGTTLVNDGLDALSWVVERTGEFGIDADRIAVMGDSGGGGVAAGVAIAARDAGIALRKQILIYPMLDDRNVEPDLEIQPFLTWNYDNNYTGWSALLGDSLGAADVSPLAAPARLTDFAGLAPAFIDVGELDLFRDEDVKYALGLVAAGVSTELYVRPGVPHAFDRISGGDASQRSWEDRYRAIQSL